jgi:hypothetical protein
MHQRVQRAAITARALAISLVALVAVSCASLDPGSFLPEPGWYHGVGTGSSAAEAGDAARRDLVSNGLTGSRDRTGVRGAPIEVSAETARAFALPKLRPYAQKKAAESVSIAYRMKVTDWDKLEDKREAAVRSEIAPRVLALKTDTARPLADRLLQSGQLLGRLRQEGLSELLTEAGPGTPLMSALIESICREQADGLAFTVDPQGGFIETGTAFRVRAAMRDGKSPGSLPIRAAWSVEGAEPVVVTAATDLQGSVRLELPSGEAFRNRTIHLAVSTHLAPTAPSSRAFVDIDAGSAVGFLYHHFDDVQAFFSAAARVPAGPFTAGAPPRDRRATKKEAARAAETGEFLIDRYPVTNALYGMFLEDTSAETFPEYWENPDYNQGEQPVIGVSWEDANGFAAWLSGRLGVTKRLPTEDEWEKAARGGLEVLYPWGDQGPAEGTRANFSGNGRFSSPSPVGSFQTGVNAWGLFDMAGNVWQWTSTTSGQTVGGAPAVIVKGGSWMDGPTDLRISNRRELDPSKGYVDVGFRLVTEVTDE